MKKLALILAILIIPTLASAATYPIKYFDKDSHYKHDHDAYRYTEVDIPDTNAKDQSDDVLGLKADAPNLVRLTKNTTIGVEAGKDLNKTSAKEGWFGFLKVTWTGTFFDFSKDNKIGKLRD